MGREQAASQNGKYGRARSHGKNTLEIVQEGVEARKTMRFADGSELEVDFIVFSTGIRPRDKLATPGGLDILRVGVSSLMIPARLPIRISTPSVNAQAGTTVYLVS